MNLLLLILLILFFLSILILFEFKLKEKVCIKFGDKNTKRSSFIVNAIGWNIFAGLILFLILPIIEPIVYKNRIQKDNQFKEKVIEKLNQDQNRLESYKKALEETYKQIYKSSEDDAKQWAENFFISLPIKKELLKDEEKINLLEEKKQKERAKIALNFALADFDKKVYEFSKKGGKDILLNNNENFTFYSESPENKTIREIKFSTGNKLIIELRNGLIKSNGIRSHPELRCFEEGVDATAEKVDFKIYTSEATGSISFGKPLITNIR